MHDGLVEFTRNSDFYPRVLPLHPASAAAGQVSPKLFCGLYTTKTSRIDASASLRKSDLERAGYFYKNSHGQSGLQLNDIDGLMLYLLL